MEGPPVPPAVTPRPPGEEPAAVENRRRLRIWLLAVTVVAIAAAGAAGYAISEIESTKDQNRRDDQAVNSVRADVDVLRKQLTDRLDTVEGRVDDAADANTQRKLQDDLTSLDKRVTKLDKQTSSSSSDDLTSRVDDLESRVDDLESKK